MAEILIIDDEPQIRRLLVGVLNGAGHRVCEATNGRDGIELFHRAHPALVITDIVMPDTEGIETIRELPTRCDRAWSDGGARKTVRRRRVAIGRCGIAQ